MKLRLVAIVVNLAVGLLGIEHPLRAAEPSLATGAAAAAAAVGQSARPPDENEGRAVWAKLEGFQADEQAQRLWNPAPEEPDWERAARSARFASLALDKVQRWLHERCLPSRDPSSGLFRPTGREWNYQDTAADCYPFYVWAAYYTDVDLVRSVMTDVLTAEQKLCNRLDRLPVPYDMDAHQQVDIDFDRMIFGASEYVKDGLIPIVELTGGHSQWFERMRGIVDDIFKHARIDTPYGKIPSTNIEVNGELLQVLPRLYSMTGERRYLEWGARLADHYLLAGGFVPNRLSDHGCEIIGGLGLFYAVCSTEWPQVCERLGPHLEFMFDEILRRGTNSDGVIVGDLQPEAGPHDEATMRDGWGYDLIGFLDYDLAQGGDRYRKAIERPLRSLLGPRYLHHGWGHNSRDNVADSVEGGLYLLQRISVTEAFVWADREIATLLVDHTDPNRLWGVHKLEANTVRTVLIHTMLHTRGTVARPWQRGLELGAAPSGKGICLLFKSDRDYDGRIAFDVPRHRRYIGLQQDWPRLNAMPEWFTVEPDDEHRYEVLDADAQTSRIVTGRQLHAGLPVHLAGGGTVRWIVMPQ